jgi:hypothetical protein
MADFEGYDNAFSFTPVSSFHEDDAPWLYLKLKDSVMQVSGNWWFWNKGNQDALLTFDTLNLSPDIWDTRSSDNPDGTKNLWITRLDFDDYAAHDQWCISTMSIPIIRMAVGLRSIMLLRACNMLPFCAWRAALLR